MEGPPRSNKALTPAEAGAGRTRKGDDERNVSAARYPYVQVFDDLMELQRHAGILFGLAYPRQTFFVCILVLGSAVLLELSQLLTPDRHARVIDVVRKIVGGAIGIAFASLAISLYRRGVVARTQNA